MRNANKMFFEDSHSYYVDETPCQSENMYTAEGVLVVTSSTWTFFLKNNVAFIGRQALLDIGFIGFCSVRLLVRVAV